MVCFTKQVSKIEFNINILRVLSSLISLFLEFWVLYYYLGLCINIAHKGFHEFLSLWLLWYCEGLIYCPFTMDSCGLHKNIIAFTKKKRTNQNKTKLEGTLWILTCLCISTQTDDVTTSSCGERNCHSFTPKYTHNDGHQFCVSICFV